jgi:ABC-type Zn uptake system ZnuABC Zn-binding protein ZnuA
LQRIAKADALLINGLGLEDLSQLNLEQINSTISVIDTSAGIPDLDLLTNKSDDHHDEHEDLHDKHDAHSHHYHRNPHLFASPQMAAKIAIYTAEQLSRLDPSGAPLYLRNAKAYSARLKTLGDNFVDLGRRLINRKIITQHQIFDYLAKDMNLEIAATLTEHAEHNSAADVLEIIKIIKQQNVAAIFTEPQYSNKLALALAQETDVATHLLDPCASGPEKADVRYCESVMRNNLIILEKALETR